MFQMKFTAMSVTYKIGGLSAAFGRVDSYNTIDVVQHPLNIKTYVIEAHIVQNIVKIASSVYT